ADFAQGRQEDGSRSIVRKCLHSGLPRCLTSVRGRSVLVIPVSQRPHPGCSNSRRCGGLKIAPDDHSVSTDDVIIVIALSASAPRSILAEQEVGPRPHSSPADPHPPARVVFFILRHPSLPTHPSILARPTTILLPRDHKKGPFFFPPPRLYSRHGPGK